MLVFPLLMKCTNSSPNHISISYISENKQITNSFVEITKRRYSLLHINETFSVYFIFIFIHIYFNFILINIFFFIFYCIFYHIIVLLKLRSILFIISFRFFFIVKI